VIERLLQRLHNVFNRNADAAKVISISSVVPNLMVNLKGFALNIAADEVDTLIIDISAITVGDLVAIINNTSSFVATLPSPEYNNLLARGLLFDGEWFLYPSALLYQELQTYTWTLEESIAQRQEAEKQLYANTAEGSWLDFWLSYFSLRRFQRENDPAFFTRGVAELFSPKVNNKALMKIISKAVGYYVDVRDMGSPSTKRGFRCNDTRSRLNVAGQKLTNITGVENLHGIIGVYLYNGSINNLLPNEKAAIVGIMNRYKASGKSVKYFAPIFTLKCNVPGNRLNDIDFAVGPGNKGWLEVIV
jgi:hypothetical protein